MQISSREISNKKSLQNSIWEGLGLHLGGAWDGLGRLLGALGPLLPVFLTFKINIFCNIGPRWAPRAYWDRFWEGSGRIWKVWGRVFGTLGYLLDRFWELLAKKGPAGTDSRVRAGSAECAERLNPPHPVRMAGVWDFSALHAVLVVF